MIKKFMWSLILTAYLASSSVHAAEFESLINIIPTGKKDLALTALSLIPTNQRQGLQEYLTVTGIEAFGLSNKGFSAFNRDFLDKNVCVQNVAAEFYLSIWNDDLKRDSPSYSGKKIIGKSKINMSLKDFGLKPGWLWERALKYSSGDKLLAMQLIGVCGHDDFMQLSGKMKFDTDRSKSLDTAEFSDGVPCPSHSSQMYLPKSLGSDFDVPQDIKEKVVRVQYPGHGDSAVPAKAYHIMGSAYASCFLVRRGIPGLVAKVIAKGAINAYRSSRVCEQLNRFPFNPFPANKNELEFLKDLKKVKSDPSYCFKKSDKGKIVFPKSSPKYCGVLDLVGDVTIVNDADVTDEILLKKIQKGLAKLDSATMFKSSEFYKITNSCSGAQLSYAVKDFLKKSGTEGKDNPCPVGLDKDRCDRARQLMDTYLVDFEWSESQHLAGAQFAADNCPSYLPLKSPEIIACNIMGSKINLGGEQRSNPREVAR